jgi:hypothetical protein
MAILVCSTFTSIKNFADTEKQMLKLARIVGDLFTPGDDVEDYSRITERSSS